MWKTVIVALIAVVLSLLTLLGQEVQALPIVLGVVVRGIVRVIVLAQA
jgi:hypothetical protein